MSEPPTIKVRDDGPYKVTGPVRVVDVDGRAWDLPEGPVALCRCGLSADKPFCDGSHKGVFASRERSSATPGPAPRSDG